MMRGGIWINLVALVAITAAVMTIAGAVFGISL